LSLVFQSSLLKDFTVVKKHNVVWVRITCGLGSDVWKEYTACVFRRLSEAGVCLFRTASIPDDLVFVWKDKISVLFRLK
jgi:hypothetical protein